jgi:sugar phosphate isomerase/epimerase
MLAGLGLADPGLAQSRTWRAGLQLWTVRDLLRTDLDGTLRSVADIGYREVELPGSDSAALRVIQEKLKRHKLDVPSLHVGYDGLRAGHNAELEDALRLGAAFVVCPSIEAAERRTADDWKAVCQTLGKAGRRVRGQGLTLAYHNHDFEFVPFADGTTPFDLLVRETDPSDVKLELDVYWAAKAGRDPLRCLKDNADRIALVHLKDMAADGSITEVGAGVLPIEEIVRSALSAGAKHLFVEQDDPLDPLRSIRSSLRFLEQLPPDVRPQL